MQIVEPVLSFWDETGFFNALMPTDSVKNRYFYKLSKAYAISTQNIPITISIVSNS